MSPNRLAVGLLTIGLGAAGACAATDQAERTVAVDTLVVTDTVITTASARIGAVGDLAVRSDGRLYLSDLRLQRVLAIGPDGTEAGSFGREGSGPGEFLAPMALAIAGDTVWVYDRRNARVQVFDADGRFRRGYPVSVGFTAGGITLNDRGDLAAATGGRDSALVAIFDADGTRAATFGTPIVPPATGFDFTSIKERSRRGVVPDEFRNDALPVWGDDGSLWLAFYAEPRLHRYAADGRLLWTRHLDDPVLDAVRAEFVRKNQEEKNPAVFHPLRYVADGTEVHGDLWLALDVGDSPDGVILVFDRTDGDIERRIVLPGLPGIDALAIDTTRHRLYLAINEAAMVVATTLD
ncbi:MAG TPA: hypothetical protein VF188_16510 [Longimicrobiales bacterium]